MGYALVAAPLPEKSVLPRLPRAPVDCWLVDSSCSPQYVIPESVTLASPSLPKCTSPSSHDEVYSYPVPLLCYFLKGKCGRDDSKRPIMTKKRLHNVGIYKHNTYTRTHESYMQTTQLHTYVHQVYFFILSSFGPPNVEISAPGLRYSLRVLGPRLMLEIFWPPMLTY